MPPSDELSQAVEVVAGKLFFVYLKRLEQAKRSPTAAANLCYSIDNELIYEPFCEDFGPLNLGQTYRFCQKTHHMLQVAQKQGKKLFCITSGSEKLKSNTAVLVGAFQILYLDKSVKEAYDTVRKFEPFVIFRDASCLPPTFALTVQHCLQGLWKAKEVGFIDWNSSASDFNVEEYEAFERVEGGDLNWIVPKKLAAFAGPSARRMESYGYKTHVPEDYAPYFKAKSVSAVVRLNNKVYDARRFTTLGINHYELYFPDGSCPHMDIVWAFLEICENERGALAVHCKAGLGRTGVLICSYMMRKYGFTAEEALGYIRICRPGSVIGPQQNYIKHLQAIVSKESKPSSKPPKKPAPQEALTERSPRPSPPKGITTIQDRRAAWSLATSAPNRDPVLYLERKIQEMKLSQAWRSSKPAGSGHEHLICRSVPENPSLHSYGVPLAGMRAGRQDAHFKATSAIPSSASCRARPFAAHLGGLQPPQQRVTKSASGLHSLDTSPPLVARRLHTSGGGVTSVRGVAPNGQPRKAGVMRTSMRRTQSTGRASTTTMRSPLTSFQRVSADDHGHSSTRIFAHRKTSSQF